MLLNDTQRETVLNALRIAKDACKADYDKLNEISGPLADAFAESALQYASLANRIEESNVIEI